MRDYQIIIEPTIEPISIATARSYLKIANEDPAQDELLNIMISTARRMVELVTGLSLCQQTVKFVTDEHLRSNWISAPLAPIETVLTAISIDASGAETLISSDMTFADGDVTKRFFVLNEQNTSKLIKINYVANYESIPAPLKIAILRQTAWLYDHRDDLSFDNETILERGVRDIISPYRWSRL